MARLHAQQSAPARPAYASEPWMEDWSVLADPATPSEAFDGLKYIRLGEDPLDYLSFGARVRDRVETLDAAGFGTTARPNTYLLHRIELHADLRLDDWQVFLQVEDARAPGKTMVGPADADRLDVEQAFIARTFALDDGTLKLRAGRQEFGFDLQRFVSAREGPNVRQAFDALWADYERGDWRLIGFASHPTQTRDGAIFDDYSGRNLVLHGLRLERRAFGPGDLAVYYLRYENAAGRFAAATGRERRNALDGHYTLQSGAFDVDIEGMGQQGDIGGRSLLAWAVGSRAGVTLRGWPASPHLILQFDAGSGNHSDHGHFGTFNPLFPNGSYFPLAGLTTYANLVHVRPAVSITPAPGLSLQAALGLQWRQTVHDAIYTIPTQAIAGTAGHGHAWTAAYLQLDASQVLDAHTTLSAQAVRYQVGQTIRAAGGHDTTYAEVQVSLAW